ncbi:Nlp family transcriptional regulator [Rhodoplanes elegans]|uniref:Nlp family transcriptional regulator n=1 Tax=Rhodoplanes elegans TaxID=29408 RepID=A0A327KA11_9BRAD|nr:helix-turn-helix domain-containing protein [Rhodoplanes elegans]MBK5958763.1 Nlp family transcriptional regulator [Rhodoplanes elegans]RAI34505.1 Nlp family transcriptional regulator [Rhodoplanes elegans]
MRRRRKWDRHAIKAEVHRRGLTLIGIARAAGLEDSACKVALHRRNFRGERAIAAALGKQLSDLWPERYPSEPISHNQGIRLDPVASSPMLLRDLTAGETR